jgi:hypothetical protein
LTLSVNEKKLKTEQKRQREGTMCKAYTFYFATVTSTAPHPVHHVHLRSFEDQREKDTCQLAPCRVGR